MLPDWARYRTHCEVIGGSQYGKTSFAVWCRRRHITADNHVISLDYKSGGYRADVAYIAEAYPEFPAIFLNVSDPDVIVPYNPFSLPEGRDLATHANHVSEAVLRIVSDQSIADLKNYIRVAEAFFAHVAVAKIPLSHAVTMLEYDERQRWLDGAQQMPNAEFREEMRRIAETPKPDWKFEITSLRNRLRPFTTSTALRRIACKPGVNLGECIERGISVFVNATPSDTLPKESARIFLGLLLSDIMLVGLSNASRPKSTFLYLDEAQEYSTPDLGATLDLVLASGIRATLIHHYAGQMDARTRESLSVNAGIKVIFGGLSRDIRKTYAEEAYEDEANTRWHKQDRIAKRTEYLPDTRISTTKYEDGTESCTTSDILVPHQVNEIIGHDDYTREEVLSRLAERLKLGKREFFVMSPDNSYRATVPDLARYLYSSPECLEFRKTRPGITPDEADRLTHIERSRDAAPKRTRKSARLFNAE